MTFIKSELPSGYRQVERGARDTSSQRARVWSLERAAGISLSREKERDRQTDRPWERERKRETGWHNLQRLSEHLPGLNSVCLSSWSCIGSVKGFTVQRICIALYIYDILEIWALCVKKLSKKGPLLHDFTLRNACLTIFLTLSFFSFLFSFDIIHTPIRFRVK